jgi:hypothetical protein
MVGDWLWVEDRGLRRELPRSNLAVISEAIQTRSNHPSQLGNEIDVSQLQERDPGDTLSPGSLS